jgi:hypothetical protein
MSYDDDTQGFQQFIVNAMRQHGMSEEKAAEALDDYLRYMMASMAEGSHVVILPRTFAVELEELRRSGGSSSPTLDQLSPELRAYILDPRNDVTEQTLAKIIVEDSQARDK